MSESEEGLAVGCSEVSHALAEPVDATAPHAVSWVGVVTPGSWPATALELLPVDLRTALDAVGTVRPVLLRPLGRSSTDIGLVLAGTVPGRTWLAEVPAEDAPAALAALSDPRSRALARLAVGREPGLGRRKEVTAVLVCTNGARDACCARFGRGAALALEHELRGSPARRLTRSRPQADVWECSHLGGHRFAPTALLLPTGVVLGGLGPGPDGLVGAVRDALAGKALLDGYRGRTTYPPAEQAAETAVRRYLAMIAVNAGPEDVHVDGSEQLDPDRAGVLVGAGGSGEPAEPGGLGPDPDPGGDDREDDRDVDEHGSGDDDRGGSRDGRSQDLSWQRRVFVRHSGGRTFRVLVRRVVSDELRPASCGASETVIGLWESHVDADPAPGIYVGG